MATAVATFGMGCFWGAEHIFRKVSGMISTTVGYMGGSYENPTYRDVCTGRTGHAEVVQVLYDPDRVSYERLLEVFWESHDPTTLNRQGPDVGSQYRSVIFYHTPEQREVAVKMRSVLERSGRFARPIVTEILSAAKFYRAEEYHQKYFDRHL
ncbi:MAG: peptide-methionine (S)-S-oxide reductase MsrA [Candidatus Methanosuratincola petrocarbonis]|nr:peptide-methionine (S)-S-oxide reductase MsrA [Candidatus Methanosuratincola sp.]